MSSHSIIGQFEEDITTGNIHDYIHMEIHQFLAAGIIFRPFLIWPAAHKVRDTERFVTNEAPLPRLRALFITQPQFDTWASSAKRWHRYALGVALLFVAVACIAANVIMGPRLVREGTLLWFGTHTEGTVRQTTLEEAGKFKGGATRYRLTIDYRFTAADGTRHDGSTIRTDVHDPPEFTTGDPIGVYYSPSNPANSVAEHNLRTDVYALVLFLPFLGVMGIGWPAFWAYRSWRWTRES